MGCFFGSASQTRREGGGLIKPNPEGFGRVFPNVRFLARVYFSGFSGALPQRLPPASVASLRDIGARYNVPQSFTNCFTCKPAEDPRIFNPIARDRFAR